MKTMESISPEVTLAVELLKEQGWCVIKEVVPADSVATIRNIVIKEEQRQTFAREAWVRTSIGSADQSRNQKLSKAEDIIPRTGQHSTFLLEPRFMGVLQRLLGAYVRVSSDHGIVTFPGNEREFWHADWPYNQTVAAHIPEPYGNTIMHLGSLVMLTDFTYENGGTLVLPGSHLLDHNPTSAEEGQAPSAIFPGEQQITGTAGSIIIYDSRLWHSIAENRTNERRVALAIRFAPWWLNLEVRQPDSPQAHLVNSKMPGRPTPVPMLSKHDFEALPKEVQPLYRHRLADEIPLRFKANPYYPSGSGQKSTAPVDDSLLFDLRHTRFALPMTQLAINLGLFEFLDRTPADIITTAGFLGCSERAAEAMLAIEAAMGLLEALDDSRFIPSIQASSYLLPSSPFYRPVLLEADDPLLLRLQKAFSPDYDSVSPLSGTLDENVEPGLHDFVNRMDALARPAAYLLAEKGPWAGVQKLLDVGGGAGSMCLALAECHPEMRCTLLERKPVCDIAAEHIAQRGLSEKVNTFDLNMLTETFPTGYDAVLFSNIFHNWDGQTCLQLARKAFNALVPGGVVVLHEVLLSARKDGPLAAACFSATMLLSHRGKQYTLAELQAMLTGAGFEDCRVEPALGRYHIVWATKSEELS